MKSGGRCDRAEEENREVMSEMSVADVRVCACECVCVCVCVCV